MVASFADPPPPAFLTFEPACNQKSGERSGEFYHVSDIKVERGRENLIGRGWTSCNVLKCPCMRAHKARGAANMRA